MITDDLKWAKNTKYIVKKAMRNIWTLRRLKSLNLVTSLLKDIYIHAVAGGIRTGSNIHAA